MSAAVLRTIYVEDEAPAALAIRDFINHHDGLELVGGAGSFGEAKSLIDEVRPDVALLDIHLPGGAGIEVLEQTAFTPPHVVFTTAYDHYAVQAFEIGAVDYLLKPFGAERFNLAVDRILERAARGEADTSVAERAKKLLGTQAKYLERIYVRAGPEILPLPLSQILRLEACDSYVRLQIKNRDYYVSASLNSLEPRLEPDHFKRLNRRCIANMAHVASIRARRDRRLSFSFTDGAEVIASRERSKALRRLAI